MPKNSEFEKESQDFTEFMIDDQQLAVSRTLTAEKNAIKEIKQLLLRSNFDEFVLSDSDDMKRAKAFQEKFFEALETYDNLLKEYKNLLDVSHDEKRADDLRTKVIIHQAACMKPFKEFCNKYHNDWKEYTDMQIMYLKLLNELQKRTWLDTQK